MSFGVRCVCRLAALQPPSCRISINRDRATSRPFRRRRVKTLERLRRRPTTTTGSRRRIARKTTGVVPGRRRPVVVVMLAQSMSFHACAVGAS